MTGYESFTADQISLGLFRTASEAADAISAAYSGGPMGA
jgi:hypothetical protein